VAKIYPPWRQIRQGKIVKRTATGKSFLLVFFKKSPDSRAAFEFLHGSAGLPDAS
jgi:hypothetical protein